MQLHQYLKHKHSVGKEFGGVYFRSNKKIVCVSNEGLLIQLYELFESTKLVNSSSERIKDIPQAEQLNCGLYLVNENFQNLFKNQFSSHRIHK